MGLCGSETVQTTAGYDVRNFGKNATGGSTWDSPGAGREWGAVEAGTKGYAREGGIFQGTGEDYVFRQAEDERESETGGGRGTS